MHSSTRRMSSFHRVSMLAGAVVVGPDGRVRAISMSSWEVSVQLRLERDRAWVAIRLWVVSRCRVSSGIDWSRRALGLATWRIRKSCWGWASLSRSLKWMSSWKTMSTVQWSSRFRHWVQIIASKVRLGLTRRANLCQGQCLESQKPTTNTLKIRSVRE